MAQRLSQYFSGSTSGFIDVEIFLVAGGGGGGANGPGGSGTGYPAGAGGGGAVYYGMVSLAPGTTCYIQIGGGGAGNTNHETTGNFEGSNGGMTAFRTPTTTYRVFGGGGGGGAYSIGRRGGCNGGDHGARPYYSPTSSGVPSAGSASFEANMGGSWYGWGQATGDYVRGVTGGGALRFKNGIMSGFSGGGRNRNGTGYNNMGGGGAGSVANGYYGGFGVYTHMSGFTFNATSGLMYGKGGSAFPYRDANQNIGEGGPTSRLYQIERGSNGGSGVVMINYSNAFGNATVTGSENGPYTIVPSAYRFPDYSPSDEYTNSVSGVKGYYFRSSGSITLP